MFFFVFFFCSEQEFDVHVLSSKFKYCIKQEPCRVTETATSSVSVSPVVRIDFSSLPSPPFSRIAIAGFECTATHVYVHI